MSSLLCVKNLDGNVQVHDRESAGQLSVIDEDLQQNVLNAMPRSKGRKAPECKWTRSEPVRSGQRKTANQKSGSIDASCLMNGGLKLPDCDGSNNANTQGNETQEQVFNQSGIHHKCTALLQTEQTFVQDVKKYVEHADMLELRKKELLHKTWNDRVYEPIRSKIVEAMNGQSWPNVDRRRRELYRQYLEHLNKKGHVFLDTMDAGEYYAQALCSHRPSPITVQTSQLCDPLLSQARERNREDQTVLRCSTGQIYSLNDIDQIKLPSLPLVPLGRHNANSITWLEMPYGNIESAARKGSRMRMKGNCTESQIDFEQWSKLAFNPRTVDRELKLQKKRFFQETPPFGRPARKCSQPPFAHCITSPDYRAMCPVST